MSKRNRSANTKIVEVDQQPLHVGARWSPTVGPETLALLNHLNLPGDGRENVLSQAVRILSRGMSPQAPDGGTTGLAVGYVQSGKTMSFTTVTALARDNGYGIVIAITGTSVPLFTQSTTRLKQDLRLDTRTDRQWKHFANPSLQTGAANSIEETLADWEDKTVDESERQTILITVMKNHTHLDNLIAVLSRLELSGVPALVIDDEADQAGLNTAVRDGDESATYRRLLRVRGCLPHHTYLQYTATPQAPLLITIIDALSPEFAEVLEPGSAYVGGHEFFVENPDSLIKSIPVTEIPARNHPLTDPPETLLEAMRVFFLGVAAGLIVDRGTGNRSMMVHPSQLTGDQLQYFHWVEQAKDHWREILGLEEGDPDRQELVEDFETAYQDLKLTVEDLPTFDQLVSVLPRAIRRTQVKEVNTRGGPTPQINWRDDYAHILVGGQAMDRGFTVEGLTVTYMPRRLGVGNADTIQQRARFFGYKRRYLGYCRVYLEDNALDAYTHYVVHEEDVRRRLIEHSATGKPLSEWKRAFFLTRGLRPTRKNVLLLEYMQGVFSDEWFALKAPHDTPDSIESNREVVNDFLASLDLEDDQGHPARTTIQKHKIAEDVLLKLVYEQLLTRLRLARPNDSQKFTGLLLQIEAYLEAHPEETCTVYQMSGGERRERSVDNKDEIPNLFQGSNSAKRELIYPGDREIKASYGMTIQIHNLLVTGSDQPYEDVPAIAIWVPAKMAESWVIQEPET
jgi:hypothetical protein